MRTALLWFASGLLTAGFVQAQDVELEVELMNELNTAQSRKGDLVSARVVSPAALQGDVAEGKVTEARSGAKLGGKSVLSVSFDTLRHGGAAIAITSQVKSMTNSKGKANLDEEGRAVRSGTGNVAKAAAGTGLGAVIGGIAGGGKGAAIGAAVGGAASVAMIQLAADAPNISFKPGSRFVITAATRSGPALATYLRPAARATAASPSVVSAPVQSAAAANAATAPAPAQPDLTAVKVEFVPGDRAIFFDDFTDMAGGEPPPHWKVRGGTAELRTGEGVRQLAVASRGTYLTPNLTALPKNFTMEADLYFRGHGTGIEWNFKKQAGQPAMFMRLATVYTKLSVLVRVGTETITSQYIPMNFAQPVRQALWLQNGRMRLYLNGERVFDVNQIDIAGLGTSEAKLFANPSPQEPNSFIALQRVRFAESMPDFSQVITSSGRYVTHGILFDTDSDVLKPESAPVLKTIAAGLTGNPALKLMIEGHTDAAGNAAHNLDLSKRRAEAVKAVLAGQFGVDAGRLQTAGLGASKPVDSNDTPQGRAQNRRVEFVRQ